MGPRHARMRQSGQTNLSHYQLVPVVDKTSGQVICLIRDHLLRCQNPPRKRFLDSAHHVRFARNDKSNASSPSQHPIRFDELVEPHRRIGRARRGKARTFASVYGFQIASVQLVGLRAGVAYIRSMGAASRIRDRSLGTASRILASEAPLMAQLASTSHMAMRLRSRNARRSSTVCGTSSPHTAASTLHMRFCG